jgi:hypothetical protein
MDSSDFLAAKRCAQAEVQTEKLNKLRNLFLNIKVKSRIFGLNWIVLKRRN